MASRIASLACVVALAAAGALALPVTRAGADGDPASDVLLGQSVFFPYTPAVPLSLQRRLTALTLATARAGYPIKVALIAAPTDLGTVPDLFGQPQNYADFLYQEISFQGTVHLLVVMAAGYGVHNLPAAATAVARVLPRPGGRASAALAQAAITAVPRLAAAAGHPLAGAVAVTGSASGGGSPVLIVILVGVACVVVAGAVLALRRRPAAVSPSGGGPPAGPAAPRRRRARARRDGSRRGR